MSRGGDRRDGRVTDTRERLIDAAVASFVRSGPGNASWGELCAAAGTTKGVVAHHFPGGKEELVVAAVERNASMVDGLVERLVRSHVDPAGAIVELFDRYADLLDADPDRGCPIAASVIDSSAGQDSVRAAAAGAFARWIDLLAARIGDRDLAVTVVAAMEGSIVLARAGRDPDLLRRTGRVLARQLSAVTSARGESSGGRVARGQIRQSPFDDAPATAIAPSDGMDGGGHG